MARWQEIHDLQCKFKRPARPCHWRHKNSPQGLVRPIPNTSPWHRPMMMPSTRRLLSSCGLKTVASWRKLAYRGGIFPDRAAERNNALQSSRPTRLFPRLLPDMRDPAARLDRSPPSAAQQMGPAGGGPGTGLHHRLSQMTSRFLVHPLASSITGKDLTLNPADLPGYALRTAPADADRDVRCRLVFTFTYATWAAKKPTCRQPCWFPCWTSCNRCPSSASCR